MNTELLIFLFMSLVILIPVIYTLPLSLTAKGKVIVVAVSFSISTAGLFTKTFFQLWQIILLLIVLTLFSAIFLTKRFSPLIYSQAGNSSVNLADDKPVKELNTMDMTKPEVQSETPLYEKIEESPIHADIVKENKQDDNSLTHEDGVSTELSNNKLLKEEKAEPADMNVGKAEELEPVEELEGQSEQLAQIDEVNNQVEELVQTEDLDQTEAVDQAEALEQIEELDQAEALEQTEAADQAEALEQTEELDQVEALEQTEDLEQAEDLVQTVEFDQIEKLDQTADMNAQSTNEMIDTSAAVIDHMTIENSQLEQDAQLEAKENNKKQLQKQIYETTLLQAEIAETMLDNKGYERILQKSLSFDMPQENRYTLATMLMKHYINKERYPDSMEFLKKLEEDFKDYPMLSKDIQYLQSKFAEN